MHTVLNQVCMCVRARACVCAQLLTSPADLESLRVQAEEGARMGYTGKQVIHPDQVPVVQQAFSPSSIQTKWATELIDAFNQHQQTGKVRLGDNDPCRAIITKCGFNTPLCCKAFIAYALGQYNAIAGISLGTPSMVAHQSSFP